jgi:hypothetical protein
MAAAQFLLLDRASSGFPNEWSAGLDAPQSASDVDLENLIPFVDVDLGERS